MNNKQLSNRFTIDSPWLGGLLGGIFAYLFFGPLLLDPTYIDWILKNGADANQHFLGWEFFRNEQWHFPLGVIASYGFPIGTSIVYMDGIPLFALLFKLFSPVLPHNFQYVGFWCVLCCVLQGFFAWLVVANFLKNIFLKIMVVLLFIASPIALSRLVVGHEALGAHWLILAGFYLYNIDSKKQFFCWPILIALSALIHAYLMVMVIALWIASLAKNFFVQKNISLKKLIIYGCITFAILIICMWVIGYFVLSFNGVKSGGYDAYKVNLLSIITPDDNFWRNGSFFLKTQQLVLGNYEGFSYFGVGMLFLSVIAFYEILKKPVNNQLKNYYLPMLIACAIMAFYAVFLGKITIGEHKLLSYHLPRFIEAVLNVFRVSGRFFWPMYYFIWIVVLQAIVRRNTLRKATFIICMGFLLQVADFSGVIKGLPAEYKSRTVWDNPLKSPFWDKAGLYYRHLIFLPPTIEGKASENTHYMFGQYAIRYGLTINNGYFARSDPQKTAQLYKGQLEQLRNGNLESNALYIITNLKLFQEIKEKFPGRHIFKEVDHIYLIASEWPE